jgi:hypothetical protein
MRESKKKSSATKTKRSNNDIDDILHSIHDSLAFPFAINIEPYKVLRTPKLLHGDLKRGVVLRATLYHSSAPIKSLQAFHLGNQERKTSNSIPNEIQYYLPCHRMDFTYLSNNQHVSLATTLCKPKVHGDYVENPATSLDFHNLRNMKWWCMKLPQKCPLSP